MHDSFSDKDSRMRKAFAEKIKGMIGIIQQNLRNHGGDIELVDIEPNNTVKVRLQCEGDSPEAKEVFKSGVKQLLKQRVPEVREVVTVD